MKAICALSVVLAFAQPLAAQKHWVAEDGAKFPIDAKVALFSQPKQQWPIEVEKIIVELKKQLPNLDANGAHLRLINEVKSPGGTHFLFQQTLFGRDVFRGSVKVNLSPSGHVLSLFDHTTNTALATDHDFPDHAAYRSGLEAHYAYKPNGDLDWYKLTEVYFTDENEVLTPCIRLEVADRLGRYYEMVLNKQVRVIYQNDLLAYHHMPEPIDTLVTLSVFMPDPLTSAQVLYGAPYADNNDSDSPQLTAQRVNAQARVTFDNGLFYLKGPYVEIQETSPPTVTPATSTSNVFNFTRAQDGFEDINAYYHIWTFQNYIQSLGFNNLVDYAISVDTHALNGSDNSNFNPGASPPRLSFGEGGVDDAEDADVVIHEYGHAIMHSAAPNTNNGTERRALDEAVGDYFASSYSRALSNFGWDRVFSWDGHNEYWPGRNTISTDHYPENLNFNLYTDADIWSATLMQIWGDIGREITDALMLQAAYSFSEGMTMSQAAQLFIQADTLLFGGAHFAPIRQRMYDRGLIPWNVGIAPVAAANYRVLGSSAFAAGQGPLVIELSEAAKGHFVLRDVLGRTLAQDQFLGGRITIAPMHGIGIYFVDVMPQNAHRFSVKVVSLVKE